jgi:hypothetical protein
MAMRLTDEQLEWLAARVPDAAVNPRGGRPPMDNVLCNYSERALERHFSGKLCLTRPSGSNA